MRRDEIPTSPPANAAPASSADMGSGMNGSDVIHPGTKSSGTATGMENGTSRRANTTSHRI